MFCPMCGNESDPHSMLLSERKRRMSIVGQERELVVRYCSNCGAVFLTEKCIVKLDGNTGITYRNYGPAEDREVYPDLKDLNKKN